MPPPQATSDLHDTLQRYQLLLVTAGSRLWRGMRPANFDGSWQAIAPQMVAFTAGAQLAAAQAATAYVPAVLAETDQPDEPEARVRPQAFAGVASDGRTLPGLLEGSVVAAKRAVTRGFDGGDALALGEKWLRQALESAVADAMRDATAASIAVRPRIGYVRMVDPPCCARCAVLAGVVYRFSTPFNRHPQCDCLHVPTTLANADTFLTKPDELVRRGLVKDLSQNQRDRLADGANLNKVLNESRDNWRQRMAADRKASGSWATNTPIPRGGVQDFLSRLTSQVDAARALKTAGIAN